MTSTTDLRLKSNQPGGKPRSINEPTINVARVPKKNYSKAIITNEIGRHVPSSLREERQIKVDALVVIQAAGER